MAGTAAPQCGSATTGTEKNAALGSGAPRKSKAGTAGRRNVAANQALLI